MVAKSLPDRSDDTTGSVRAIQRFDIWINLVVCTSSIDVAGVYVRVWGHFQDALGG